jgi:TatD DNase family protein
LIDTHAHLSFDGLAGQVDDVLERSRNAGVNGWITVSTEPADFNKVADLCTRFQRLWGTAGIHPHHAKDVNDQHFEQLIELAKSDQIVAIGETGLDFHYNFSKQQAQKQIFRRQLQIAINYDMPIIVHCRNAFKDTLDILDEFDTSALKVVFHCHSGPAEQTAILIERGYYISFTGIVTFKNADEARKAAQTVPLERMMLETDCPFMSPEPFRKQRINEPALMVHTAAKLAEIKGMQLEEFARIVTQNSVQFFGL